MQSYIKDQTEYVKRLAENLYKLLNERIWLKIVLGMVMGIGIGLMLSPSMGFVEENMGLTIGNWLALPGRIFLSLIQMIVVPSFLIIL